MEGAAAAPQGPRRDAGEIAISRTHAISLAPRMHASDLKDRVATQAIAMLLYVQYRDFGLETAIKDAGENVHARRERSGPDRGQLAALAKMSTHRLF